MVSRHSSPKFLCPSSSRRIIDPVLDLRIRFVTREPRARLPPILHIGVHVHAQLGHQPSDQLEVLQLLSLNFILRPHHLDHEAESLTVLSTSSGLRRSSGLSRTLKNLTVPASSMMK